MFTFDREDLRILLAPHEAPCVSIFTPTHRRRPLSDHDPIRLRNLLRDARYRVSEAGFDDVAQALMDPLAELAGSWKSAPRRDGLALFRSSDLLAQYTLPAPVPERLVVADTFHVRPLLRLLQANQRYYVLALSQKQVRLFEGTPFSLDPVELEELPRSLHDALGSEHDAAFLNVRTAGRGSESAIFHGHGDAEEAREADLRRYFRRVDAAIWKLLRREQTPLFLAGVARHATAFRELCRYPFVADHGVEGNVDDVEAGELRERVRPLVDELFRARRAEALEELSHARGRGLAEVKLGAVGRHAVQGRVRQLLLAEGRQVRGRFDFDDGAILPAASGDDLADDVLDDLAQAVLVRAGDVMTIPATDMPEEAAAAAILRW
jgi:hypothetical protein